MPEARCLFTKFDLLLDTQRELSDKTIANVSYLGQRSSDCLAASSRSFQLAGAAMFLVDDSFGVPAQCFALLQVVERVGQAGACDAQRNPGCEGAAVRRYDDSRRSG